VLRSSIIVSDEPLSAETNYRTEFVAVLNNQPQGGFITRKPTPAVNAEVASGNFQDDGSGDGGFFSPFPAPSELPNRQFAAARSAAVLSSGASRRLVAVTSGMIEDVIIRRNHGEGLVSERK
jgi:hypothetical protein